MIKMTTTKTEVMRRVWAAAVLACVACGDGGEASAPGIEGVWGLEDSNGCALVMAFNGDRYKSGFACELTSGQIGMQAGEGIYSTDGDELTFMPSKATCPGATGDPLTVNFNISDGQLIVESPDGALILDDIGDEESSQTGALVYGCFADDRTFTESPLAPI